MKETAWCKEMPSLFEYKQLWKFSFAFGHKCFIMLSQNYLNIT